MSKWFILAGGLVLIGAVAGCDWQAGSNAETLSNRYNWVNFSGVYRASDGGIVVADFEQAGATPGATNVVTSATVATSVAGVSAYSGNLGQVDILPGSVQIVAGVYVLVDDSSGALSGSGKTGTINYDTGAWSIDLLGEFPPGGTPIQASYGFVSPSVPSPAASGPTSGSRGVKVFSFTVVQNGNTLNITDNNGTVFEGKFGSLRTTGGVSRDTPLDAETPASGDTVVGDFSVSGTLANGRKVKIVGTFTGTVTSTSSGGTGGTATTTTQITMSARTLNGTWVQENGYTADIVASASPITTSTTTTTTP